MAKTYEEINERIRNKEAVVMTAEEFIDIVDERGLREAAKEVDVVTTATFGPMCSSGAFINIGHSNPKIKIQKAWLNGVNAYAGLAAVDLYIGASELPDDDPANSKGKGSFSYGGGHVIADLVAGKDVKLKAKGYGTDGYPRKELETYINIKDLNEAYLCNPRNCYQNYGIAINKSNKMIYTYMGILKPDVGNATYCSAGQLSPLLKDPFYKTIGIGTRVFLAGAQGYVYWQGTQHDPHAQRNKYGCPLGGAGTLALTGNLKEMNPELIKGTSIKGYGATLSLGIGVPIPILNEEVARYAALKDEELETSIIDYANDYPVCKTSRLGTRNYKELKSGRITIGGKEVPTSSLSSYPKAVKIAGMLKEEVQKGRFFLSEPVQKLPGPEWKERFKSLKIRDHMR
ncbi:homocysteine biosynthesis protein [Candidatus Woesearchaeota archaeon]|nr:homocysteine biosynthesis protein [Candidatus Woesearchaeota archaeon]